MNKKLQILAFRSMLGVYSASIASPYNTTDNEEFWYKDNYKVYKKISRMKQPTISKLEAIILRGKLVEVEKLEEEYFSDDVWNAYSLVLMTLDHLVSELDDINLKPLFLDIKVKDTISLIEVSPDYKELNKLTNRYFQKMIEIFRGY